MAKKKATRKKTTKKKATKKRTTLSRKSKAMSLSDYVRREGKGTEPLTNIQVKIRADLTQKVKSQMKKDGVTWTEFFTGCFNKYLEESGVETTGFQ